MLNWFRRRAEAARKAGEIYGNVVAAARRPVFYGALRVPDTPEGRYELIALHLFLALEALRVRDGGEDISQRIIEAFVADMDDCMREMGVGDMAVPKKVKRAAAGFYERAQSYRQALAAGDDHEIEATVLRWVYDGDLTRVADAQGLVREMRRPWLQDGDLATSGIVRPLIGSSIAIGAP